MGMSEVVVSGNASGFAQDVVAGTHRWIADEPLAAGGQDLGPSPYDMLLAALGSCTSMTIGMYARRKGWPLESVEVRLRHSRVHRDDCADCDEKERWLDRIEREIRLMGGLDAEQRRRLIEIANRCPVHRTLTASVRIETREIEPAT